MSQSLLLPMITLVAWSCVMLVWMLALRVPAIFKARMRLDAKRPRGEQMAELPAKIRWKADNYNHLMEQPTLFYATVVALVLLGSTSSVALGLAWAYTGLRVMHSLVQSLIDSVEIRFVVFALSTLALFGLVGIALQLALQVA
ncbi:MAPEG family protein [Isoalcanivorax beigongshangi]|uniref:MAPEG family protein n=1 Tax=Isoalcanivorax beigongshangi TaxID=3238810 RepID=A0ABV4AJL5_9GAMM